MKPLHLHIKNGAGIHVDTIVLLDVPGQTELILILDIHKLLLAFFIIHKDLQLLNLRQIRNPFTANLAGHPVSQQRVSVKQEPSLSNTVGLIVELLRHHLVEILKLLFLKDFRMKLGHAVDGIAAHNSQMSHAHLSVINDGHPADLLMITRIEPLDFFHKTAVDFFHNLINSRKQAGEQLNGPFFQCLRHNRVIGIGAGLGGNLPGLIPSQIFLIQKDSH